MPQIELLKRHTHAGVELGPSSVIDVDELTAHWLIEHGVGQAAAPAEPRRSRHSEANQISPISPITARKE